MIVQFLGCGDAFGSGGRLNTCFHVTTHNSCFLIDCGASSLIAMKKAGIDRNAITSILVTHFHADHFGGIPFFMLDAQFFSKRREPLTIVGPRGLADSYERVMETAFPGSSTTPPKFELRLVEVTPDVPIKVNDLSVRAFQVKHGPDPNGPFVAYRVECGGQSIAYTGDTEWTDQLLHAGKGADLFIVEAYFHAKEVRYHLNLKTLEAHLDAIAPKRIVLTHMSDDMLKELNSVRWQAAHDGLELEI
jgi:ribonuclease BN (tRNA processing enzyme)